jgi:hypothetical protein
MNKRVLYELVVIRDKPLYAHFIGSAKGAYIKEITLRESHTLTPYANSYWIKQFESQAYG